MYRPKIYDWHSVPDVVEFMKRFSFGIMVTSENNIPTATHLPFLILESGGNILLSSHCARQNRQWQSLNNNPVMVIFSEPHAYISPSHYEKEQNVPTWNYLAVHAYGTARILSDPDTVRNLLERTINTYEESYLTQWKKLPEEYKSGMINGITAFEITVTELQAKKKLSQNKTERERSGIAEALSRSPETNHQLIAEYMNKERNR